LVPGRILDVNVSHMVAHVLPKFPCILSRPGPWFGTVRVKDWIGSVEDPLETGTFIQELKRMLPTHSAVIHKIFMNGRGAGLQKSICPLLPAAKNLWRDLELVVAGFEAHNAHVTG